jgi:hypothetical protein
VSAIIKNIDLVDDKVLLSFYDGTATLFSSQFLYVHRNDEGTEPIPTGLDADEGGDTLENTAHRSKLDHTRNKRG